MACYDSFVKLHQSIRVLFIVGALGVTAGPLAAQTPVQTPVQTPAPAPVIKMEGYPAPGEPAKVTILSTGTGTKKALRYSIPADFKTHLELTVAVEMTINALGQAIAVPSTPIRLGADVAVTKIEGDDITYSLAFTGATLDGDATSPLASALQAGMAGISGVKGITTVSTQGVTKSSSSLEVSDAALKTMLAQSSVENLSSALPEEAVGVGARWEVRQSMANDGSTQFQSAIYEVTAIDGPSVVLKVTTTSTAPSQTISNPMVAAVGGEMRLDSLTGSGTGTVTVRLDSLIPTSAIEQATSATMTMIIQGQTVPATMDGKVKITVTPVKRP